MTLLNEILTQLRQPGRRKSEIAKFIEQYGAEYEQDRAGQLFHFVLVKAGEKFPFGNGMALVNKKRATASGSQWEWYNHGEINDNDRWFLRPVTPITREMMEAEALRQYPVRMVRTSWVEHFKEDENEDRRDVFLAAYDFLNPATDNDINKDK